MPNLLMKLIFIGSGEFGLPTLQWMHENHEVVGVVTQPDKPAGRKRKLTPTPIGKWAQEQSLNVYKTNNVNEPLFIEKITALNADASIVVAFGQKLAPEFITALGELAVNLHSSLLPKYRGAAPINWAIIKGEAITGVSVIELAQKMDAGKIYNQLALTINPNETAGQLHDRLASMGPKAIAQVLDNLKNNKLNPFPQDETQATYAPKLSKADGTVDFNNSAVDIRNKIHGLTPWPGCKVNWYSTANNESKTLALLKVKIAVDNKDTKNNVAPANVLDNLNIATKDEAITLLKVQLAGKRPMEFKDFIHGNKFKVGDKLSVIDKN